MTEDQREAWRKALAAATRGQRQRRGRRVMQDASRIGPGMIRLTTVCTGEADGDDGADEDDGPWHD
jgi:hypothetical protein